MSGRVYDLRAWKRVRRIHLAREPLCRMCSLTGHIKPAHHVDHVLPISQGGEWFEAENLQSLCHECHSVKTMGDKGYAVRLGCGIDGVPLDPRHHWGRGGGGATLETSSANTDAPVFFS